MKRIVSILLAALLLSGAVPALAANDRAPSSTYPPIISWQAPAAFTPPHAAGRTALTDIAGPLPLVPMVPCRQYDSRSATPLADNTPRTVVVTGAPCGVLTNSFAVAVNITIFSITGAGSNGVFKVGTAAPPTTAWINYPPSETQRGNAGVLATNGTSIVVQMNQGAGSLDFTIDIFGYYPQNDSGHLLNAGEYFEIATSIAPPFASINARNNSTVAGALALQGIAGGASGDTIAVFGTNGSSGFGSLGVSGLATNGIGVLGTSTNNVGTKGFSTNFNGVWAESTSQDGLFASGGRDGAFIQGARYGVIATTSTAGVADGLNGSIGGTALAGSAGVHGLGNGLSGTYGVRGQNGAAIPVTFGLGALGGYFTSSTSGGVGTLGLSTVRGMQGSTVNATTGAFINSGVIGFTGTSGVHSFQDITAGGTKSFVEPHPTDPGRQIVYIAMEGPEAGTYFRGRGRFEGKSAVIVVPESFRLVTEEEGLTVQITPIGRATAVGVTSMDLNQILVEATRDVEFSYLVQGVRHHRGQFEAIQQNTYFVPSSADARMDPWPPQIQKQLVDLGIYFSDGRVNMATADRMGWSQKWHEDEARAKAAQEAAAAAAAKAASK